MELRVGVRNDDPLLLAILNKVINNISDQEHRSIVNSWSVISYKEGIDYKLFIEIVVFFIFLAGFLLYRQKVLKEHNLALQSLSFTDKLTGLNNRMKLDYVLEDLKNGNDRYQRPFSALIIDADHFKRINDTYGHLCGDRVLVGMAQVLKNTGRSNDVVGRWGGEEFLVICPETPLNGARTLAESIRKAISDYEFENDIRMTVSIGVGEFCPGESVEGLIKRADDALYLAKGQGRNRVVSAH